MIADRYRLVEMVPIRGDAARPPAARIARFGACPQRAGVLVTAALVRNIPNVGFDPPETVIVDHHLPPGGSSDPQSSGHRHTGGSNTPFARLELGRLSSCAFTPRRMGGKCTRSAGDGHEKAKCTICPCGRPVAGIVDSESARKPGSATPYGRITGVAGAERAEWPRPYSRVVASARGRQESHDRPVRHPDDRLDRGHRLHFTGGRGTGHAGDHAGG